MKKAIIMLIISTQTAISNACISEDQAIQAFNRFTFAVFSQSDIELRVQNVDIQPSTSGNAHCLISADLTIYLKSDFNAIVQNVASNLAEMFKGKDIPSPRNLDKVEATRTIFSTLAERFVTSSFGGNVNRSSVINRHGEIPIFKDEESDSLHMLLLSKEIPL